MIHVTMFDSTREFFIPYTNIGLIERWGKGSKVHYLSVQTPTTGYTYLIVNESPEAIAEEYNRLIRVSQAA
jgi:hypothetical protein